MGGLTNPAFNNGAQIGAGFASQQNAREEANRIAARDEYVGLQKNILNNPNNSLSDPALNDIKDPVAKANEITRRKNMLDEATNNIIKAHQPHEGGSLLKVLTGLIHGAPVAENNATTVANPPHRW